MAQGSADCQQKLIILDMNGVLMKRSPNNKKVALMRPHLDEMLCRLWNLQNQGVRIAVWSSMKEHNLMPLVEQVFGPRMQELEFIWDQEWCTVSYPPDMHKPLLSKELRRLAKTPWSKFLPDRVLLIDDDEIKCRCNEKGTSVHPSSYEGADGRFHEDPELRRLASYLESMASSSSSVQTFVRDNPYSDFEPGPCADDDAPPQRPAKRQKSTTSTASVPSTPGEWEVEAYWPDSGEWLPAVVVEEMRGGEVRIYWDEDGSESVVPSSYIRWGRGGAAQQSQQWGDTSGYYSYYNHRESSYQKKRSWQWY